jgi:hypothetical protein
MPALRVEVLLVPWGMQASTSRGPASGMAAHKGEYEQRQRAPVDKIETLGVAVSR